MRFLAKNLMGRKLFTILRLFISKFFPVINLPFISTAAIFLSNISIRCIVFCKPFLGESVAAATPAIARHNNIQIPMSLHVFSNVLMTIKVLFHDLKLKGRIMTKRLSLRDKEWPGQLCVSRTIHTLPFPLLKRTF